MKIHNTTQLTTVSLFDQFVCSLVNKIVVKITTQCHEINSHKINSHEINLSQDPLPPGQLSRDQLSWDQLVTRSILTRSTCHEIYLIFECFVLWDKSIIGQAPKRFDHVSDLVELGITSIPQISIAVTMFFINKSLPCQMMQAKWKTLKCANQSTETELQKWEKKPPIGV